MNRWILICFALIGVIIGQAQTNEDQELREAMRETGGVPVEVVRVLEKHLSKYPQSAQRPELERSLARLAVDLRDDDRIVKYAEPQLKADPDNLLFLERVSRILSLRTDKSSNERALNYAKKLASVMDQNLAEDAKRGAKLTMDDLDRAIARSLVVQARATGHLGKPVEASALAAGAYQRFPLAEAAREESRWLVEQKLTEEAIQALARAFASPDPRSQEEGRAKDRMKLGEIYKKLHNGSEDGLGDLLLRSFDQVTARLAARKQRLQQSSPNTLATSPLQYQIGRLDGQKLDLTSLKGKVIVFDFWATWCGPCRGQHPLYEEVRQKFKDNPNVILLSVNTDEDRSIVAPFIKQNQWNPAHIFFEDGLAGKLEVSSIPTTVIFNKKGEIASRMNGFIPERFVDMLSSRITELLAE
jgi:thiol-disulfide isomerase/thioredoxin